MDRITSNLFIEQLNKTKKVEYCEVANPIKLVRVKVSHVEIQNVIFEREVELLDNQSNSVSFVFKNCTFIKPLKIENSTFSNAEFLECTFHNVFTIRSCVCAILNVIKPTFKMAAKIDDIKSDYFSIQSLGDNNISIINSQFNEFSISSFSGNGEIYIGHKPKSNLSNVSMISDLDIYCADNFSGSIIIEQIDIEKFSVRGSNIGAKLILRSCTVCQVFINSLVNRGYFLATNIKVLKNSALYVLDSNLGKLEVFNLNFRQFDIVNIKDSQIEDIVSSNIIWCEKIVTKYNSSDLRENYRQLKNIMIKSNNKPEEIKFWGLEMNAYYKLLRASSGNWDDKFILWTNYWSNKHGLSWSRALTWVALFNLIFYSAIKICIGETTFNWDFLVRDIVNYLEFISPIHKYRDIFAATTDGALLFDVIGRLFSAYLIFQLLKAFRRFVK